MGLFLPKYIVTKIPSIDEVKNIPEDKRLIYLHFFNPIGIGDWYVMGGNKEGGEWMFYGAIVFSQVRVDNFSLKDLKMKSLPFNMKILRDEKFEVISWKELVRTIGNS